MLDLESLSLEELRQLRNKLDKAIANFETRKRRDAISAIEEAARSHGYSLTELTGAKITRRSGRVPPRYVNPDNPEQTWIGRGRRPHWIQVALDSGKSLKDLEV